MRDVVHKVHIQIFRALLENLENEMKMLEVKFARMSSVERRWKMSAPSPTLYNNQRLIFSNFIMYILNRNEHKIVILP